MLILMQNLFLFRTVKSHGKQIKEKHITGLLSIVSSLCELTE